MCKVLLLKFQESLNQTTKPISKDMDVDMNGKETTISSDSGDVMNESEVNKETSDKTIDSNKRPNEFEENMNEKKIRTE